MNTFPYLLVASLYLLLFYSCYWLLLRRNTFFGLNRVYLLASVVLSVVLPLVELPSGTADALPIGTLTLPTFVVGNAASSQSESLTSIHWVWFVYGLGVVVMLVRFGLNIRSVFNLIERGQAEHTSNFILVRLPDDSTPSFSFGRYLVLNHTDALTKPDALMRHEEAHIRQCHSADILFLEIVQAAFWFNPVLWLYKCALQEVHEFLADRTVLKTPQPDYPRQLVAYALNMPITALTTPFVSKSTLKQRIVMLQKPASHRRALLGYIFILPVAACLIMCTQSGQDQPQTETAVASAQLSARKAIKVEGPIYDLADEVPQFPGGKEKLGKYLGENLKYPAAAQKANVEGMVFVNFVLTKEGEITDVKILKGIGFGADEEAIRVVSQMPRWTPAKKDGKAVNMRFNLPIRFLLEDENQGEAMNDFLNSVSKHKNFILDGKPIDKSTALYTIKKANETNKHISFTVNDKTNTIAFNHVDQ